MAVRVKRVSDVCVHMYVCVRSRVLEQIATRSTPSILVVVVVVVDVAVVSCDFMTYIDCFEHSTID